jgi:hypothetical protein
VNWNAIAAGLIPSIGVGLLFWFVMRSVIRADRNERAALAKYDAEQEAARAVQARGAEATVDEVATVDRDE